MVVLLIVVGLVVAGLQTLPIGTDPVPLPGSSTTPSPSSSTPTTNKSTGVGVPELTDSALYRQTLSGTCPKPVKTISSRSQYEQQVDDLIACLETLYRPVIDSAGGDFSTVSRTFYDKTVASPCGKETDAYAFYCETDNTMYFSNRVYEDAQYARLSVADVVVHEYGHHVQAMMNFFDESDGLDEKRTVTIRRIELQVFCWTYYVFAHVPSFELTGSDKEFFLDVWGDTTDAEGHGSVKAQQYWGPRGLDGENLVSAMPNQTLEVAVGRAAVQLARPGAHRRCLLHVPQVAAQLVHGLVDAMVHAGDQLDHAGQVLAANRAGLGVVHAVEHTLRARREFKGVCIDQSEFPLDADGGLAARHELEPHRLLLDSGESLRAKRRPTHRCL